ncbi:MAG: TPR repeat protein [Flammeovirgaceae bacterium]|jgi:TPR repeat protein
MTVSNIFRTLTVLLVLTLFGKSALAQEVDIERIEAIKEEAKAGKPRALYLLGVLYEEGKYERQNLRKANQYYRMAADKKYDSAYYALGRLYEFGTGVTQNHALAFSYYSKLEDTEHSHAIYRLGTFYEKGLSVPVDRKRATSLYLKARMLGYLPAQTKLDAIGLDSLGSNKDIYYIHYKADRGDAVSQFIIGKVYEDGVGIEKNIAKGYDYYQKSAAQNYPKANIAIGDLYAKGKFLNKNERLAAKFYLKAATEGDKTAKDRLNTIDFKALDIDDIEYYEYTAKNKDGSAIDFFRLYKKYWYGQGVQRDYNKAIENLQKAVLKDYEPAIMTLGDLHMKGVVVDQDYTTAFKYFKHAAFLKNDSALYLVGDMYARGVGVPKDDARAVKCFLQSGVNGINMGIYRLQQYDVSKYIDKNDLRFVKYLALKGDVEAQLASGKYHFKRDESEAVRWLRKAAELENAEAQVLLGRIFYEGRCNMPIDNEVAQKWFVEASKQKNLEAFRYLADMYSQNKMSPEKGGNSIDPGEQLETAFQMANEYFALREGKLNSEDAMMYKIMGNIYSERKDYPNTVIYLTDYINTHPDSLDKPLMLIEAFETRASAYLEMKSYASAITDLDIADLQLEEYKEHPDVKLDYRYYKGYILTKKIEVYLGQENYFKACNLVQQARRMRIQVKKEYVDICFKN